jgi:DNA-binding HxlR family transcriptional regulator
LDIFEMLALRGTRKVLAALHAKGPRRYSELVEAVGFQTTTSRALRAMLEHGIVAKRVLDQPYRPVEYKLTVKGEKLYELALGIQYLEGGKE